MISDKAREQVKAVYNKYKDLEDDPTIPSKICSNIISLRRIVLEEREKPTRRTRKHA